MSGKAAAGKKYINMFVIFISCSIEFVNCASQVGTAQKLFGFERERVDLRKKKSGG
jgi:hypothetical protein